MKYLIPILLMLNACGLKKDKELEDIVPIEALENRADTYCKLSKDMYERQGYVHSKCDGLLFTALHGISCGYVDLDKFEKAAGLWKRSPTHDCYAKKESRTGVSRDMLLGVTLYSLYKSRLDYLENIISYGENNSWDMCGGEYENEGYRIGRCVVTSNLKSTIYKAAVKLGYNCDSRCKQVIAVPQVWDIHADGYVAHLTVLMILARGLSDEVINGNQLEQLKYQANRQPKNSLFHAILARFNGGDMTTALSSLDKLAFPMQSLPNSSNHCEGYLWQRDFGKDWQPCDDNKIHAGTDLIFLNTVIQKELE